VSDPGKPPAPAPPPEPWEVKVTGPARRALETGLPAAVAWAAYTFITERLPTNPHRLGGELNGPYEGMRSAHLGTYRVVYRIDAKEQVIYVLSIRLRGDVYGVR
jgi:mRNA interferase RelE/StbE